MEIGSGNQLLYWGYFTAALSLVIAVLLMATHNGIWNWGWMLMFVFWLFIARMQKKPLVVSYTDKVTGQVWQVMGTLFVITFAGCFVLCLLCEKATMILMMPLSLLYVSIGTSITGIILRERSLTWLPLFSFAVSFYMLESAYVGLLPTMDWMLLFGLSFLITMAIPGHILNHKAKKQCSLN